MINIIKFEIYKITRRKTVYFIFMCITTLILSSAIYNNYKSYNYKSIDWRSELEEKNKEFKNQINSDKVISNEFKLIFQAEISINNFYLNNNINPYEYTLGILLMILVYI